MSGNSLFRDTIVRSSHRLQARDADPGHTYTTADGFSIEARSNEYDEPEIQEVVGVVESLEHGPELDDLSIFVATPAELSSICGFGTRPGPASDPAVAAKRFGVPIDGTVTAALTVAPGSIYRLQLRDPRTDRVLDSAATDRSGAANLDFSSCGRAVLRLEVRRVSGGSDFTAAITTP